jgi:periplasmic protein TonB
MFEDSLMESSNKIKAKSKYWSMVSLLLNGGVLIAVIIWPLLHPQALPTDVMAPLIVAPPPPPPPPPSAPQAPKVQIKSETLSKELQAPSKIPKEIKLVQESAIPPSMDGVKGIEGLENGTPGGMSTIMDGIGTGTPRTVKKASRSLTISSGVMLGNLLDNTMPQYPAIARAARIQGVVVLQATISTTGLIKDLRVMSGPPMLQQAAMDAVRSWRYKPYLLNGNPVEVETTINVVFNLGE